MLETGKNDQKQKQNLSESVEGQTGGPRKKQKVSESVEGQTGGPRKTQKQKVLDSGEGQTSGPRKKLQAAQKRASSSNAKPKPKSASSSSSASSTSGDALLKELEAMTSPPMSPTSADDKDKQKKGEQKQETGNT